MIEQILHIEPAGVIMSILMLAAALGCVIGFIWSVKSASTQKREDKENGVERAGFPEDSTGVIIAFLALMSVATVALSAFGIPANLQSHHITGTVSNVEDTITSKPRFDYQTNVQLEGVDKNIVIYLKDHQEVDVSVGDTVELFCSLAHGGTNDTDQNAIACVESSLKS